MDVNRVLQNTRQYFQGIPSSSPTTGELAPGASVGYSSPPVFSSATSTATSATNPFPSYQQQNLSTQSLLWSSSSSPSPSASAPMQNVPVPVYLPTTIPSPSGYQQSGGSSAGSMTPVSSVTYPRNYSAGASSVASPYRVYENTIDGSSNPKSMRVGPTNTFAQQSKYTAPSITRFKDGSSEGMYNMDSIVCQPNVNHSQSKNSKMKAPPVMTSSSSSSLPSTSVYKPSIHVQNSRVYNHRMSVPQIPSLPQQAESLPTCQIPSSVSSSQIFSTTTHQLHQQTVENQSISPQNYSACNSLPESRVGYQQQASYQVARRTSVNKISQHDHADGVYYKYRLVENAAVGTTPPTVVMKRDSPLDLSVKTIRQSADSTAHDDIENAAAYSQHFVNNAHPSLRVQGRHSHLPQLPYTSVGLPSGGNTFNGIQSREMRCSSASSVDKMTSGYAAVAQYAPKNGQVSENVSRLPTISDFRNEQVTMSITCEQKQKVHHAEVNAQSMQYSHYHHAMDTKARGSLPGEYSIENTNHDISPKTNHLPPTTIHPKLSSGIDSFPRKRRPTPTESPSLLKTPRVSTEWRQRFDKELENRLKEYENKKAREEKEKLLATKEENKSCSNATVVQHIDVVPEKILTCLGEVDEHLKSQNCSPVVKQEQLRESSEHTRPQCPSKPPFMQYLEQQQKAQHKLPVQPIQLHHSSQQWYQQGSQRSLAQATCRSSQYKPSSFPGAHQTAFTKLYDNRSDTKNIQNTNNSKSVNSEKQRPLPPFKALPLKIGFPSKSSLISVIDERVQDMCPKEDDRESVLRDEEYVSSAFSKEKIDEHQSTAALMASALTHPRIRTKAELKQVISVNKMEEKMMTICNKLPESDVHGVNKCSDNCQPNKEENEKQTDKSKRISTSESKLRITDDTPYSCNHRPAPVNSINETAVSSAGLSSEYVNVTDRQHSPRKSKSEKDDSDMKGSSSETTVFEFKDSDSEPEICNTDLHSLNEMRKDRKTVKTPSEMPVIIDQQREDTSDDYKWLEACDELIQQFSSGGRKTRSCRKKMGDGDMEIPNEKPVKKEKLNASDVKEEKLMIPTSKIKKEPIFENKTEDQSRIVRTPLKDSRIKVDPDKEKSPALVPKLVMETRNEVRRTRDNERDLRIEERRVKDIERERRTRKQSPETRGQRSNISTTRMRIQNLLEKHSSDTESDTDGDARDDDDDDDDDFEEILPKKIAVQPKSMKKINVQSAKAKIKVSLNKKKKKRKIKKKMKKKKKKTMKQKQKLVSKKLKKVDEKREKMRRMILRRIETRKSKLEAIKSLRKTKMGNSSSDDKQPIMTRKMAKRECQKDNKREEMGKKKSTTIVHFGKRKVMEKYKKGKIERTSEKIRMFKKTRTKCKRPETRNQAKFDKMKKTEKLVKKSDRDSKVEKETFDDVTRRMLRSRNVILLNEKHKKRINKREKNSSGNNSVGTKEKQKSVIKIKKESKEVREMKEKVKIKGEEKLKVKEKEIEKSKENEKLDEKLPVKVEPSWEEELFNYKYSLRMPVKLINIARPVNWPKNSGSASSLPDLDRKETDSDLLNGISKPRATKRKNRNESKFSNTKEFKDSVKHLKEKFDQKIEEKNKSSDLHTLMMENRIKIIPKSSDGPELLPTPSLDSFRSKMNSVTSKKDQKLGKDTNWTDDEDNGNEVVEDSLIGYFRKETVDVFKEVFEKHKIPNQFKTVILESRTRTQTKELKHHATLKQVFGLDRPASAPPVSDSKDVLPAVENDTKDTSTMSMPSKDSTNDMLKPWHKNFAQIKFLMGEEGVDSDENNKDFGDSVNFIVHQVDSRDPSETELMDAVVMKKKNRTIRRKCRSSGFDYIRKKKKIKKEDDDYFPEEKEKKKVVASVRPTPESIEDIQNEIKSWVVNKGIGETVLHKAARLGYLDISSYCLEKLKCSPSPTDNAGYTPLHEACTRGHLKIAKMLLKYGADVSASARGGIRPLHEAVENGDIELVRLLLSYGADPLLSTYGGQTPLSLVKENHDNLKEFLLLYLADIQGTPSKPWHFNGVDDFDREMNGYDPLENPPSPVHEEMETLEFEMSEWPLPILYRFKDELDYWVLYSDLPVPVRDAIKKHQKQNFENEDPSSYVLRKVTRTEFDENVDCVLWFVNKHLSKSKFKSNMNTITMVKYNEKLLTSLNVQKISMTFS